MGFGSGDGVGGCYCIGGEAGLVEVELLYGCGVGVGVIGEGGGCSSGGACLI